MATEIQNGTLYGWFAVDQPTALATAADVLLDYNRREGAPFESGWRSEGTPFVRPGGWDADLAQVYWQVVHTARVV